MVRYCPISKVFAADAIIMRIVGPPNIATLKAGLVCLLLVLFQIVPAAIPSSADAQGGGVDYTGVDVVFLVDQSGSMGGSRYGSQEHPQANDPNDLRFSGLQQMVERLAGYRLNYFHDSQVQFQIAVVYFGSSTATIVPPTIVDPDTSEEWQPLSDRLRSDLSADAFPTHLGNTDHLGALEAARRILGEMQQTWQGGQHLQVVLMLTDGEWSLSCPEAGEEAPEYCQDGEFQSFEYRQMLDDYIRTQLPYPRYRFFVGAINDRSYEYWSSIRKYWENWTNNNAELVDANTMWAFFEGILAELTVNQPGLADKKTTQGDVVEIPETQDRIPVPPYLQEITFVIHKPAPEVRVKLYQEGQPLEGLATTTVKDQDKYIESITLRNPEPGYITIERPVTTGILRIFMIQIGADVSCDPLSAVPQFIPTRLQCTLSGRGGTLLPYTDPRFRLTVEAEIEGDGTTQRLTLMPEGTSVYTAYYLPAQPGEYGFHIVASTERPDGTPFELFRKPPEGMASFTVEPTTANLNAQESPTALLPVSLSVTLVDANGVPLRMPSDSLDFVQMRLRLAMAGQEIDLDLIPGAAGFGGSFIPSHPGTYRVRLLGQVKDPNTGQPFTAYNQEIGSLEVLPPQVVWEGFSSPWPEYRPASVTFFLADHTGNPIGDRLESGWQLKAEAQVQSTDSQEVVPLSMADAGHWTGRFTPQTAGDFNLMVSAWAESPAGEEVVLVENLSILAFTIRPMQLVRTPLLRPEAGGDHAWRDILWRPHPLEVEAAIVDEKGGMLSPAKIQKIPGEMPFEIEVTSPDGASSGPLKLTRGSEPGRYLASFDDYQPFAWYAHRDLGWYEVHLQPVSDLKDTYIYEEMDGVTARVHLTRHRLWWILPAAVGALLAVLLVFATRQTYLHLWSIEGTLAIEGAGPLWTRRLRDYGKHTLAFTSRDGLPAVIRKVVAHQPRGRRNAPVEITIHLRKGARIRQRMVDGARKPLGGNMFVSYQRGMGAGAAPKASLSLAVLTYGLVSLLIVMGLGFVLFAVISSLG